MPKFKPYNYDQHAMVVINYQVKPSRSRIGWASLGMAPRFLGSIARPV